jgi:hypothetical protein
MPHESRFIAILLLAVMVATLFPAAAFAIPSAPAAHPAGCHGHKSPVSSPVPISYQCCVSGHPSAIPASAFSSTTLLPDVGNVSNTAQSPDTCARHADISNQIRACVGPPCLSPLRI